MNIKDMLARIEQLPDCTILPPSGNPIVEVRHRLPDDLKEFYRLCGGVEMYKDSEYALRIVTPEELAKANPIIIGDIPGIPNNGIPVGDISEDWYVIAEDINGDYLTIDLGFERLGRCYDSFHELHPGNSQIVAWSFSDLLERIISNKGKHWYWLQEDFVPFGLAYDNI